MFSIRHFPILRNLNQKSYKKCSKYFRSYKSYNRCYSNGSTQINSFSSSTSNNSKLKTFLVSTIFFSSVGFVSLNDTKNDEEHFIDEDEYLEDENNVEEELVGETEAPMPHITTTESAQDEINEEESRIIRHLVNHYNDLYEKTISNKEKQFEESLEILRQNLQEQYEVELNHIRSKEEQKLLEELDAIYTTVSSFHDKKKKSLIYALKKLEHINESLKYYEEKNEIHKKLSGVIASFLLFQQRIREYPTLPFDQFLSVFHEYAKDFPNIKSALDSIPKSASSKGLASHEELKTYFNRTLQSSRSISSAGQDAKPYDYFFAYVKELANLNQTQNESDDLSKLTRAELFFEKRQFRSCIEEINSLSDKPKEVLSQFREKANEHVIVETAIENISKEISGMIENLVNMQPPQFENPFEEKIQEESVHE